MTVHASGRQSALRIIFFLSLSLPMLSLALLRLQRAKVSHHAMISPSNKTPGSSQPPAQFPAPGGSTGRQMVMVDKKPPEAGPSIENNNNLFDPKRLEGMTFRELTNGLKAIYETLDLRSNEIVPYNDRLVALDMYLSDRLDRIRVFVSPPLG